MEREKAVEQLAQLRLLEMSPDDRKDQLETMAGEDWSESIYWDDLAANLKRVIIDGKLDGDLNASRYDPILLMSLKDGLAPVTNEYLSSELKVDTINGKPEHREACPCCGRRTLDESGAYAICMVCLWEDDGLDDETAELPSGPNEGLSLTQARLNYLNHGLYSPKRMDLMKLKEPAEKYVKGRSFKLFDGRVIEQL